jgi:signal transduction histidine kinase
MTTQPRVKCLLVDDLEENLVALSALLLRDDVELLQARSGAEALELLLAHDVALAFLDVQMPDMDGFELAELMRGSERTRHVPIIFVTAGAHDERRLFQGYGSGAVDFLHKPIDAHILRNKAEVFFQLYRQKQQIAHELRERTETLRLNEMFTAVLGHDLRTPLTVILTSAELLLRLSSDEDVRKSATRMMSAGRRMSRMIEDMLDLARARLAGGIPVKRAPVDLGPLVQRIVQEHLAAFPARRIETAYAGDLQGDWDADRLAQATANLLTNALQHGTAEQPARLTLDGTDRSLVRLEVCNAGTIAPETLEHLFDPFRGGHQTARQGLGLGLYIVQQIVHAHHGTIGVSCEGGERVRFTVEMPRRGSEVVAL